MVKVNKKLILHLLMIGIKNGEREKVSTMTGCNKPEVE